ncbi:MAG: M20/M25/M40 family metallo-hydrolase, partial [Myxococcota bacterium]|nr:M20/M25/M40 family metallo-hydrolase [Myxococcota bacterium]
ERGNLVARLKGEDARLPPPLLGDTLVSAVLRLAGDSPTARVVGAMMANTATPTCLRAGTSTNVIPAEAVAEVDGRTLPGQNTADLVREIRAAIGKEIDIEVVREAPPVEAPLDHPMLDAIRAVLREHDPDGAVVPSLTPGYTDAKAWSRLGIACYGFTPVRFPDDFPVQYSTLFHSTDERIPLEGLRFGLDVLGDLVERWARGGVEGDR